MKISSTTQTTSSEIIKSKREIIFEEIQSLFEGNNLEWDKFIEFLMNQLEFNTYFEKLKENGSTLGEYYWENKSKIKIKILFFIVGFHSTMKKYSIAKDVSTQLKIAKQTVSNNINVLEREGLIRRELIENTNQKYLIPNL